MIASLILAACAATAPADASLFAKDNLVAWCIVPFDAKKRGPEERVAMLQKLGFKKYAYDWRAEHLPTFDREVELLKKAKIELTAVWFPGGLGKDSRVLLDVLKKHSLKTQLWVMLTDPAPGKDQAAKVAAGAAIVRPIAEEAAKDGHTVGLYNHGGWGGEPENQLAVIESLKLKNVGIVYNQHHGHDHLDRFPDLLKKITPHLLVLNLNGMTPDGEKKGRKILVLGTGDLDLKLLKTIRASEYRGPIGILGHTNDDAEERLHDNLDGLAWLLPQLDGKPAVPLPTFRTGPKPGARLSPDRKAIEIVGYPGDAKTLSVVVDDGKTAKLDDLLPVLGELTAANGVLRFEPRFPLAAGVTYRILGPNVNTAVTLPKADLVPTTTVTDLYPKLTKLPENALRVYIHFSRPMQRGGVYKHIKLLDGDGKEVAYPFLQLDEELWSPDGKRFTLFFDPGRQKQGLVPREELGPSLTAGKKYTLVVEKTWPDENGAPLKESFRHSFTATAADATPIDPAKWRITPPTNGTPLRVAFEKPLDHALATRLIRVVGPDGKPLAGTVAVAPGEKEWTFRTPADRWPSGDYTLVIDTELEDVCGNRIGEPFEVDVFKPVTKRIETKTVERRFTVK